MIKMAVHGVRYRLLFEENRPHACFCVTICIKKEVY